MPDYKVLTTILAAREILFDIGDLCASYRNGKKVEFLEWCRSGADNPKTREEYTLRIKKIKEEAQRLNLPCKIMYDLGYKWGN